MLKGFLFIGVCALQLFGAQAEIGVNFEDIEVTQKDPEYFDPEKTTLNIQEIDGVERLFGSLEIVKKLSDNTQARVKMMGLSMGKYIVPTGIDMVRPFCHMPQEPTIMGPAFYAFGFKDDPCPAEPGTYTVDGFAPEDDLFPEIFPQNKYLITYQMVLGKKVILNLDFYATIEQK